MENAEIPDSRPAEAGRQGQDRPQAASTRAIAALVLGILSLICLGFLAGIPAIVLGTMELKAIKAGQSPASGDSAAKVGLILGTVGTVLTCITLLGIILMVVLGISLGNMEAMQGASLVI